MSASKIKHTIKDGYAMQLLVLPPRPPPLLPPSPVVWSHPEFTSLIAVTLDKSPRRLHQSRGRTQRERERERERERFIRNNLHNGVVSGAAR